VKYKGAAKERPGTLRRQHREQNSSLNAAVQQARERVEDDNPVMFTLPGSEVAAGKQVLVVEHCSSTMHRLRRWTGVWMVRCASR
jgi:ATPase subunit of ABC transporter with duplicated ATPase domains